MVNRFDGQSKGISFGSIDSLQVTPASVSFILILILVVNIEYIFSVVHRNCVETPIEIIVQRIEKELMIVGGCAFLIKIILNSSDYDGVDWFHDWAQALEFADLVLPITSLIYVLTGLVLFRVCQTRCKLYEMSNQLTLLEIMHDLAEDSKKIFIENRYLCNIYSSVLKVEFRVLYNLFYDESRVEHGAVDFAEYVKLSFEKYLTSIVTIQPQNWSLVIVIILLNLGRVQLNLEIYTCDDNDNTCFQDRSQIMFIFMGWFLFIIYAAIAFISRLTELNLMIQTGINDVCDLGTFLQLQEEKKASEIGRSKKTSVVLTPEFLKETVAKAKKAQLYEKTKSTRLFSGRRNTINFFFREKKDINKMGLQSSRIEGNENLSVNPPRSSFQEHVIATKHKFTGNEKSQSFISKSLAFIQIYNRMGAEISGNVSEDKFRVLFFFHNPPLFFSIIDGMVMPISFYFSLWICNFLPWAIYSDNGGLYIVLSIVPYLLSALLLSYAILVACLMRCVCALDSNIISEVIEQSENAKMISENLRNTIISRLDVDRPEDTLLELFNAIDDDDSKSLSRKEFRRFLRAMKITFSKKKWRLIFNLIDKNYDDEIAFDEFFVFLYPNSNSALEKEEIRLMKLHKNLQNIQESQKSQQSDNEYDESKKRIAKKIRLGEELLQNIKRNSFSTYSISQLREKSQKSVQQRGDSNKIAADSFKIEEEEEEDSDDDENEDDSIIEKIESFDQSVISDYKSLDNLSRIELVRIINDERLISIIEADKLRQQIQAASGHEEQRMLDLSRKFCQVIQELEEKIIKIGLDFQKGV